MNHSEPEKSHESSPENWVGMPKNSSKLARIFVRGRKTHWILGFPEIQFGTHSSFFFAFSYSIYAYVFVSFNFPMIVCLSFLQFAQTKLISEPSFCFCFVWFCLNYVNFGLIYVCKCYRERWDLVWFHLFGLIYGLGCSSCS